MHRLQEASAIDIFPFVCSLVCGFAKTEVVNSCFACHLTWCYTSYTTLVGWSDMADRNRCQRSSVCIASCDLGVLHFPVASHS